jgi:catalase (peroxidase I)
LADSYLDSGLKSRISAADTIQLAGAVAVTHCGGPQIPFQGGRIDNPRANPSVVSQLPGPGETYQQVIAKFARMGMNKTRMAVLVTGSHSLGGVTTPNGGRELFDDTPGVFDNHIFKRVLTGSCVLPIDCQIASDPDLRPLIQR